MINIHTKKYFGLVILLLLIGASNGFNGFPVQLKTLDSVGVHKKTSKAKFHETRTGRIEITRFKI